MTELYLYQTIHLNHGHARYIEGHIRALNHASTILFGRPYTPRSEELTRRIEQTMEAKRYGTMVSSFLRLEVSANGQEKLLPQGTSYYDGYALRSIRPNAVSLVYDLPLGDLPTSAREAVMLQAREMARRMKSKVAIRTGYNGVCYSVEGSPLAGVRGEEIHLSPAPYSVEREAIIEAARAAGFHIKEHEILRSELKTYDEMFWMDYRGITSLAHVDGHPLLTFTTERIAKQLERPFQKK